MIAASAPGEQRQGSEKIAGNVVEEHVTRRCIQNELLSRQKLIRFCLVGDKRPHPLTHAGITLPKLQWIAREDSASLRRSMKLGVNLGLIISPYVCWPLMRRHSRNEPVIPLTGQSACLLWGAYGLRRADRILTIHTSNLAGPFAVLRARDRHGQRTGIQAFLGNAGRRGWPTRHGHRTGSPCGQ